MDLHQAVLSVYPKAADCLKNGHQEPILAFYEEPDDDRYYLMVIGRCSHCNMPVGGDDYACAENSERYYNGLPPLPQQSCEHKDCVQPVIKGFCFEHRPRRIEVKDAASN
jgi:hypothetical protein